MSCLLSPLQRAVHDGMRHCEPNLTAVGAVGVVGFPLFFVIWEHWFPQPYENLLLRLVGAALCVPLLLHRRLPEALRPHLPAYWLVVSLYTLPFFFTFMLLKNEVSTVWSMSTLAGVFLLVILVHNWLLIALLFTTGTGLAWAAYAFTGGEPNPLLVARYWEQAPVYLFVLVAGSIFNLKSGLIQKERMDAMLAISRTIAHELRTPLLGIRSGIGGLQRYVPRLVEGYEIARRHDDTLPAIRHAHLRALGSVLQRMDRETDYSMAMIDMLLVNAARHKLDPGEFTSVRISTCLDTALARYPFRSPVERARVRRSESEDFAFRGPEILVVHVIFNLLRNGLYAVAEAGRGEVTLRTRRTERGGELSVLDTGTGIPPETLPRIYDRFYSSRTAETGSGIGLAFCRMVMEGIGGSIHCRTEYGEFTEFILYFPRMDP